MAFQGDAGLTPFFDKLPTILVLAVLVAIFLALGRHARSPRLKLWTAAWGLIFVHFFFGLFEQAGGLTRVVFIIEDGSLVLAALFFVGSLTIFHEDLKLTLGLLVLVAVPAEAYIAALDCEKDWRPLYIACLAAIFYGVPIYVTIFRKLTREALGWMPVSILAGSVSIFRAWRHDADIGLLALLTVGFGLPAFLYWRRYRRWSPGVITGASGFLLWGLVFPVGLFMDKYWPAVHVNPELWNVPKFFVAFGMILTVLEDKSAYLKTARERERKLARQLQKFAEITSRLLSGVEVNSLCHEIAQAITETSTFARATIILSNDRRSLFAAGYSGLDPQAVREMEYRCANVWRLDQLAEVCHSGEMLGPNSFLLRPAQIGKYGPTPSTMQFEAGGYWENGSVVIVPLLSGRGTCVGCLGMDDPRDVTHVTAEEMSQIELLAGDLAVTLDNAALHRQLMRSEKLAAIGQLVAGVAHELNNPLTSIVGYSELLTDEIREGSPRQKIEKMLREAQRMKRIIENLLRFARQNTLEKKSANLEALLQEVLTLQEYQIRRHNLDVRVEIEPDLPQVALNEDQFKQILFNLLNNSIDALQGVRRRRTTITAVRRDDRILLAFDDNGPGFSDINRVFDPFYTTKAIGKGTGLGLSICYGIVKEHGGEIHAMNLDPHGARILLELPVSGGVGQRDAAVVSDRALL